MIALERLKKLKQAQRESEASPVSEPVVVFRSVPQPEPLPMQQISDDEQILVDWFFTATLPTQPFGLDSARHVFNPGKFHDVLKREIEGRQSSPRWRSGATQADLRALKAVLEQTFKNMEKHLGAIH